MSAENNWNPVMGIRAEGENQVQRILIEIILARGRTAYPRFSGKAKRYAELHQTRRCRVAG